MASFYSYNNNEDASLDAPIYMLRSIIMFLSLKHLFTSAIFSTESIIN